MIYDYRDAKQLKVDLISGCEKNQVRGCTAAPEEVYDGRSPLVGSFEYFQSSFQGDLFFFGIGSVSRVPSLCAVAKDEEDDDKRNDTAGEAGRLTTEEERHKMEGYWSMVSDVTIC